MSQRVRHAQKLCVNQNKLDKLGMLNRLARLKGSALRRAALGRAIVILALAVTHSVAASSDVQTTEETVQKPAYDLMNVKLYLHNKIKNWQEFECANQLGIRESNWRPTAINKDSGAYGIFQHMSNHAHKWNAYEQMDKHIEYINARYEGSWCKALDHLVRLGWH